ncbi:PREDICTED: leucine-rich repeat-containing protein 36-like [Nanorana parkeri]|uniref:leucine-rich repeat-containing protein 36-like n=1 Tax=Nanorana parkeri TaxID=125878 RepID=UPI0008549470|nr:PREDICTED: leucine-rich repeat-containing protein 36-like [Nanorana parkeri]
MSLFSDDRPVRESERKNATLNFQSKSREMLGTESGSPSRSHLYGDRGGAKVHLDFGLSKMTEMGKMNIQEGHSRDYTKGSSPSKYQSEEHQSYLQPQTDFEDGIEYRPLPSPTRSSLRSPGPTSRVKEGHRVTFAESTMSEFFPKQEDTSTPMKNEEDISATKNPIFKYPDKLGTAFSYKNTYLTSTPVRKDAAGSERMRASTLDGDERIRLGDINDIGQGSETRERLRPSYNGEESSRERLLRLSSDLYMATHLTDPPASSSSLSALRKGFSDISKTYTLPSKPTLTNAHLAAKTTELGRDYKSAWCPEKTVTLNSTPMGMKRSSSLNSLLSSKPSDLYSDQHREDFLSGSELKRESSPSRSETSSISDVLQQLMDLVDRYWNGSGSLLHNQRFLVPARELLTKLMTSDSAKQISPMGDQLRGSRNSYGPLEDGDSMESGKLKLVKVMEENHFLRSKVYKLENQAARKGGGDLLPSQDDLRQKYEQLSLQVESLQQQLSKTNKLQETVNLLHNSQRSLVCTNEYLLQQLNKVFPNTITKTPSLPSPQRMNTDKYQVHESSNVPSLTPAYSTGQYSNPERLSACPL